MLFYTPFPPFFLLSYFFILTVFDDLWCMFCLYTDTEIASGDYETVWFNEVNRYRGKYFLRYHVGSLRTRLLRLLFVDDGDGHLSLRCFAAAIGLYEPTIIPGHCFAVSWRVTSSSSLTSGPFFDPPILSSSLLVALFQQHIYLGRVIFPLFIK